MKNRITQYLVHSNLLLQKILETQQCNIENAAQLIANSLMSGGWLYVFGSGHSHLIAEEFFYRAGGMVRVYPIFDTALMLHEGAVKSSALERLSGYAEKLLLDYPIKENDVILIASNSGRNSVPIEMALAAKNKKMKVISITSMEHSLAVNSRHDSGKRLFEISDVTIDNCGEFGDACIDNNGQKIAPTSTVTSTAIVNALVAGVADVFEKNNFVGEFFASSNTDDGDLKNRQHIDNYKNFIKPL